MESVEAAHARMIDLWNLRDLAGYMEMIHDDVRALLPTIPEPVIGRRALREVTARLFDSTLSLRVDFENLDFKQFDGVAVATGIATIRARRRDGSVVTDTSYATLTYARDGGSWKVIAGHHSRLLDAGVESAFFAT